MDIVKQFLVAEKTEAYRPPQARTGNYTAPKLHEFEPASNVRQAQANAGWFERDRAREKKRVCVCVCLTKLRQL